MGDKTKSIYPLVFADEGMGGKIKLIIPAGLRGRGYGRQNQVDYTHWLSRTRVWEAKSSRLYPLAFADEGMGGKIRLIIPVGYQTSGA